MKLLILLKNLRITHGRTQCDLAEHLAMTTANYQKLEKGMIALSVERYLKICEVLDTNPAKLLTDACSSSHPGLFDKPIGNKHVSSLEINELKRLQQQNELMTRLMNITISNMEVLQNIHK